MHRCPAPDCTVNVSAERLACPRHWYSIPLELRREVWAAYRRDGVGSRRHGDAVEAAIAHLRGDPRG